MVVSGGKLYFHLDEPAGGPYHGTELWVSDGTAAGTKMVKDITPGMDSSLPTCLVDVNGTLFFNVIRGSSPQNTYELWKSDGTASGTTRVGQVKTTDRWYDRATLGGKLFFDGQLDTGPLDWELWMTDGTTTTRVVDLNPTGASTPTDFGVANGKVFFKANAGQERISLWATDAAGSPPVRLANDMTSSAWKGGFAAMGNYVYFAQAPTSVSSLSRSDGTPAGTSVVKSGFEDYYGPDNMIVLPSGRLLFRASEATYGAELWASDGTEAGTALVKDIRPGPENSWDTFGAGVVYHGVAFFPADDGLHGAELWRSDGTAAGTFLVKDTVAGAAGGKPGLLKVVGDRIVFTAEDPATGRELWESDGTEAGTRLVADLRAGATSARPGDLTVLGNTLFFTIEGTDGPELWAWDAPPSTWSEPDGGVADGGPGTTPATSPDPSAPGADDPAIAQTGESTSGCGCFVTSETAGGGAGGAFALGLLALARAARGSHRRRRAEGDARAARDNYRWSVLPRRTPSAQ
jgi:ELWxxDGT repeat protein